MIRPNLNIVIFIIIAIAGTAIGFFLQKGLDRVSITSEMKEVAAKYAGLDTSPCQVTLKGIDRKTASSACLNGILTAYALEHRDVSPCQDVSDSLLKQDCVARVARLQNLTADEDRFCQGVVLDALCGDLATTLLASETRDANLCLQIQNELQRSSCLALVGPAGVPAPELELGENGLPVPQFGLICIEGDEACENAQLKFSEAVASLDTSLCEDTGIYLELCLNELALYRSFQENDSSYCEERQPKEICETNLAIARALDAQNATVCGVLENETAAEGCRIIVESAKDKRFDYLGL